MTGSHVPTPPDSVRVPVQVEEGFSRPFTRPRPYEVEKKHDPWPNTWPPSGGFYDVHTTWRQILDAAMDVGRDPSIWLAAFPELASNELLSRITPLTAYLHHDGSQTPLSLRPSPVYSHGAERSAKGVMSYRLGMTMTQWVSRHLIGLPWTIHAEDAAPAGATSDWFAPGKRPDLWAPPRHVGDGYWVLEAKGARRLGRPNVVDGIAQLQAITPAVLPLSHHKVVVGASVEDLVFCFIRYERSHGPSNGDHAEPSSPFWSAYSNMLRYQLIRGAEVGRQRIRVPRSTTARLGVLTRQVG
ncbi:hypothetical protein GCM10022399_44410 [Terrabacter ginsenosidimutans]|uniref:Uncharacterized protein n=1 Tax=Terrabacter ginsenosidimutans TaxID=490575 RepID=A0ABP7EQU6_9MICO